MDYPSDPAVGLVNGKFSDGDPANGIAASLDPAAHLNAITDELLSAIIASGQTPDEADKTQLAQIFGAGGSNILINPSFTINQSVYVSGAVLPNNTYGHDGWKAGAAGGDYTFTQLDTSTQITIAAGKSLIQVVDAPNVAGGTFTLSWKGTAQARFGINTKTPAGAYAASPITVTGQTAATMMSVEFNAGTLTDVLLEPGNIASQFRPRLRAVEMLLAESTFQKSYDYLTHIGTPAMSRGSLSFRFDSSAPYWRATRSLNSRMRAVPTVTFYSPATGAVNKVYIGVADYSPSWTGPVGDGSIGLEVNNGPTGIASLEYHFTADARIY